MEEKFRLMMNDDLLKLEVRDLRKMNENIFLKSERLKIQELLDKVNLSIKKHLIEYPEMDVHSVRIKSNEYKYKNILIELLRKEGFEVEEKELDLKGEELIRYKILNYSGIELKIKVK